MEAMREGSYNSIFEYILLDSIASNIYFTPTCHLKKLVLEKKIEKKITTFSMGIFKFNSLLVFWVWDVCAAGETKNDL